MARAKGFVKVMVAAPNEATNKLLNSEGVKKATRQAATGVYAKLAANSAKEKPYRQPTMSTVANLSKFRGTTRAGTSIKGRERGMRLSIVKKSCGKGFTF